jgi:hypothetical protein
LAKNKRAKKGKYLVLLPRSRGGCVLKKEAALKSKKESKRKNEKGKQRSKGYKNLINRKRKEGNRGRGRHSICQKKKSSQNPETLLTSSLYYVLLVKVINIFLNSQYVQ